MDKCWCGDADRNPKVPTTTITTTTTPENTQKSVPIPQQSVAQSITPHHTSLRPHLHSSDATASFLRPPQPPRGEIKIFYLSAEFSKATPRITASEEKRHTRCEEPRGSGACFVTDKATTFLSVHQHFSPPPVAYEPSCRCFGVASRGAPLSRRAGGPKRTAYHHPNKSSKVSDFIDRGRERQRWGWSG